MPTMGTSTAPAQAWTHASAIGRSAGPEYPPTASASRGRSVRGIECQPANRVDEREPVGPRVDDGAGSGGDVPLRRGELRVERLARDRPGRRHELRRGLGRLLDVRAREVELDHGDPVVTVEPLAAHGIVGRGEAADGHPELVTSRPASRGR